MKGMPKRQIAEEMETDIKTVHKWCGRWEEARPSLRSAEEAEDDHVRHIGQTVDTDRRMVDIRHGQPQHASVRIPGGTDRTEMFHRYFSRGKRE